jgi:hypothetical protein
MKALAIVAMALLLGACSQTTGQNVIVGINTYKALTSGSYHGAGLEERVSNCVKDVFDPSNRGSGCN